MANPRPAETLTLPDSPAPRLQRIETGAGDIVELIDDPYSDRIRCDHPTVDSGEALGEALLEAADELGRGRIVALVDRALSKELESTGFEVEAIMPGFYAGVADCAVVGTAGARRRMRSADLAAAQLTERALEARRGTPGLRVALPTERAMPADAEAIATLLDETFAAYPTPTGDADYIADQMQDGTIFRVVRDGDDVVACASADLVRTARTAELTDCATRPTHRGRGLMRAILRDLMGDLAAMGYPTAFTLARARVPGINVAFQRCGFVLRGRMAQSCRIGTGLEDMNVWSRFL